mmetsp:Transcript_123473/g.348957  ORF Transcript_123473/g.348957 Transcript_123473/m.348957 type:complete len:387 (-) Transcript_123473:97-1257(-)|eukprot:CAMPEP_0117539392 /NCGR_PEP_ID=MMETSP0784-20121206/42961_1 /TAXON_ID=39447 /ORGANISM="" /LENGTH=386 /DNA_ID=CAMNT_0005336017 /DNA_START=29 /DNA_END=1189 /DNA_ORIENTATION=+
MSPAITDADEQGSFGGLAYLLRKPPHSASKPWPLLLFLHGAGERGPSNGVNLERVLQHGPWQAPSRYGWAVLAPQCPTNQTWPALAHEVVAVVRYVCEQRPVDRERCYASGLSLGGFGVWAAAVADPQLFAALVPICGGFSRPLPRDTSLRDVLHLAQIRPTLEVYRLRHLPVFLHHGGKDKVVDPFGSKGVFEALGGAGRKFPSLQLTTYADLGHQIWCPIFRGEQFYEWLLRHRRHSPSGDVDYMPCASSASLVAQIAGRKFQANVGACSSTTAPLSASLPEEVAQLLGQTSGSHSRLEEASSSDSDPPLVRHVGLGSRGDDEDEDSYAPPNDKDAGLRFKRDAQRIGRNIQSIRPAARLENGIAATVEAPQGFASRKRLRPMS